MPDTLDQTPSPVGRGAVAAVALLVGGGVGFLLGGETAEPDVSEEGQVAMACALAEKVRDGHRTEDDWGLLQEDDAYHEVSAIVGLLRAAAPQEDTQADDLDAEYRNGDFEGLGEELDTTIEQCDDR